MTRPRDAPPSSVRDDLPPTYYESTFLSGFREKILLNGNPREDRPGISIKGRDGLINVRLSVRVKGQGVGRRQGRGDGKRKKKVWDKVAREGREGGKEGRQ